MDKTLLIRLARVIEWLRTNSSLEPDLAELAALAGFSAHYFHRNFTSTFGISLHTLMRRVRTHRAAWQLAYRREMPVTDIAFDAGYENSESFSRAFKRQTGLSPTMFRQCPDWQQIDDLAQALSVLNDGDAMQNETRADARVPALTDFPGVAIAQLVHTGSPASIMASVSAFIQWRKQYGTPPSQSRTFNIFYTRPATTPGNAFRFGIAAEHEGEIAPNAEHVQHAEICPMTCLSWVETGSDGHLQQRIEEVIDAMEYVWAFETFPPFIERLRFYPDVPVSEAQSRIYLPVK